MKLFRLSSLVVLSLAMVSGCNSGPEDVKIEVKSSAIVDSLKKSLEEMAKTGKTGSALTSLESDINGIKTSDKAKGEALHKNFLRMQVASKPDEIKAIAKEMLGQL